MKGHKDENDKKKDKLERHDKDKKHEKDEKNDKDDKHDKGGSHNKDESRDKGGNHDQQKKHDKVSHDKDHSRKGKHDDKHKKDLKLSPKQLELYKRCSRMQKIVENQDKTKLYIYKSTDDQEVVNLRQQMANCINTTKFSKNVTDPGSSQPNSAGDCKIIISKDQVIACARNMHKNGLNKIAVMSFASPHDQGGPYKKGIITQETSIVSQTLLLGSLLSPSARPFYISKKSHKDKGKDKDKSGHKSTMDSLNNGIIYSPSVPVITNGGDKLCNSKDVFYIDVISVSPVKLRKKASSTKGGHGKNKHGDKNAKAGHNDKSLQEKIIPIMEKKIRDTIYVAASVKVDGIILGAFGCGSGGNDPQIISKIFKKVLITDGYAGHFKQIIFSVPGNYIPKAFQECFKEYLPKEDNASQEREPVIEEESHGEEESQSINSSYSEEESSKNGNDNVKVPNSDDDGKSDSGKHDDEEEDIC
ncbi:hypothetical protein M9Y10_044446 [Tritrichomonas musculus]|uniref:Microbial-type PARG catalytic domain-containing protein n=1 Tax=Tritrichomonas musculus TaxID=1915356 RepID=A0ABR2JVA5_9EUKA